ncbi:YsnF/AvaK domain-containing protein [Sporosarcina contaminans]|uniref:YsnF/AvaK domain-containing protein n=1 Tax=Sporosarcina contaminans TaxID=633403 RepID=A0ABW3TW02_9BACL
MNDKTFIGMFYDDEEILKQIDDLKAQGFDGENIYVITKDKNDVAMFQGLKYGDVQTTPDSWFDRFIDFMTGEDHVRSMLKEVGVNDNDMDAYYRDIEAGGKLLYVDEGEANRLYKTNGERFGATGLGTDPNLGANRVIENETTDEIFPEAYDAPYAATNENLGRVGGEALVNQTNYETPPNNNRKETNAYKAETPHEETMRLREERLSVDKEKVEKGEISLHKDVVEEQQSIDVPVMREEVYVERRPVNEYEQNEADFRLQDDEETIHIPVMEERLEVTKKPYVSEEIVIGKREVEDVETVRDSVKHEEAYMEQDGNVEVTGEFEDRSNVKRNKRNDAELNSRKNDKLDL